MAVQRHINTRSPFYIQMPTNEPLVSLALRIWVGHRVNDRPASATYVLEKESVGGEATFEIAELVRDFSSHTQNYRSGHCWVEYIFSDFTATAYLPVLYHASEGYALYTEGVQHNGNSFASDFIALPPAGKGYYWVNYAEGYSAFFQVYVQPQNDTDWTYQYLNNDSIATGPAIPILPNDNSDTQMMKFELGVGDNHMLRFDFNGDTFVVRSYQFDCTKYSKIKYTSISDADKDLPVRLHYVNKHGARNSFTFSLKHIENIAVTSDNFMRNTMNTGTLSHGNGMHASRKRITGSKQSFTINTDYIPEYFVSQLEELIMSEYVFAEIEHVDPINYFPVNLTTKKIEKKNHLNDGLVQYTFEIETANEYINTVR